MDSFVTVENEHHLCYHSVLLWKSLLRRLQFLTCLPPL